MVGLCLNSNGGGDQGFMEGAIQAGRRAADEVVSELFSPPSAQKHIRYGKRYPTAQRPYRIGVLRWALIGLDEWMHSAAGVIFVLLCAFFYRVLQLL